MNARELIHALSAEWIEQDAEVEVWAHNSDGGYSRHVVAKVTATARKGAHHTTIEIEDPA